VARGAAFPEGDGPLYSHLRFATAASLIAFGGLIGVGVPALLVSTVERPLVARADVSDPTAAACKQQTWLQLDRNCLSRHDLPWFAGRGTTNGGTANVRAEPEQSTAQPASEGRNVATAPQEPAPKVSVAQGSVPQEFLVQEFAPQEFVSKEFAPQEFVRRSVEPKEPVEEPVVRKSTPPKFVLQGLAPQEPAPVDSAAPSPTQQEPVQRSDGSAPATKRTLRATAAERRAAKSAAETQASLPAAKKPIRSSRIARRSTNEALSVVRRFGDGARDVPGNAYAGNGTRSGGRPGLPLDIRPTSIQDVYYYSAPR
jgi:hypothetical protein